MVDKTVKEEVEYRLQKAKKRAGGCSTAPPPLIPRNRCQQGLLQRFGLHVIRSNIIPQKTAKSLSTLFQARERSNYGIPSFIDAEEAAQLIQMARQLVTTIEAKITELLEE